jgi:hypothetical protein
VELGRKIGLLVFVTVEWTNVDSGDTERAGGPDRGNENGAKASFRPTRGKIEVLEVIKEDNNGGTSTEGNTCWLGV